jgi:hypothetical protein
MCPSRSIRKLSTEDEEGLNELRKSNDNTQPILLYPLHLTRRERLPDLLSVTGKFLQRHNLLENR